MFIKQTSEAAMMTESRKKSVTGFLRSSSETKREDKKEGARDRRERERKSGVKAGNEIQLKASCEIMMMRLL